MSTDNIYLKRPTGYDAELRSVFRPIFDRIAEGNVTRERDRVFPHEQVRWLGEAGFGTLRIPAEQGGFGASLEQTFQLLAELGQADANVAHIWRNHLAFVEDRLNAPVTEDNNTWIKRFLAGEFVGGGWTEANNVTLANLATTVTAADDHWLVSGAKYYATGSLYADWLDVLGRGDDGELWTALVRADDPGVTLTDDWRGFGQRTTASGSAHYAAARAERGNVFPAAQRFTYQAHFYQIAMLAVLTGITKAAQRDGTAALKARKRNYPQGLSDVPADDPQLLQVIGELSAEAFGAQAALGRSAQTLDRIVAGRLAGSDDHARQLLIDAEVAVTQAQLVIIGAALRTTTRVFDALGASGVSEELALDRHWRNARTLASHNPVVYKARILGEWFVNGKDPVSDLASRGRGGQGN
ncbi:acyl-CoA dehydrogenase family protein [Mycolicibacterium wolinskyi]|uniref:Acyl-CoA dehydrogenase n=1 Tax=Mycolicibacterium wolinskyi TaxID=59750 RepID=A0A1X2EU94_9MYCO|nr:MULTISPECIES: acyl-CoA dehydrogenase family protein [Mycolicibacterium]MCV7287046.1 acyl-CoA dehydrogenase family protein [Mycolicibacterium wolinskyi]MCV7292539.1 acyl-CoA dehydrogenase family protein [Mycolicibacterium goodii]ORX09757.1 acyl-CoA dehydrogenase [Mycolicibacterium wolinskyi]